MSFLSLHSQKIVSNDLLKYADKRSMESGICGYELVQQAAESVVDTITEHYPACFKVSILCGPGNNGGDGYFIAQMLRDKKFRVTVFAPTQGEECSAHSLHAAKDYKGIIKPLSQFEPDKDTLIVDALFGSGISRDIEDIYTEVIQRLNDGQKAGVVSVDIPSGISGDTGKVLGIAVRSSITVCFERLRPGHVLFPGHGHCGTITVKHIGINEIFLSSSDDTQETLLNSKALYHRDLPKPNPYLQKYTRGYVNIASGGIISTGAARLCARAAIHIGVGIVKIGVHGRALDIIAAHETSAVPYLLEEQNHFLPELNHDHLGCLIMGLGLGTDRRSELLIDLVLKRIKKDENFKCVMDSNAIIMLSQFEKGSYTLSPNVILTLNEDDFGVLFPYISDDDKITRARRAAKEVNATILFKGPDTIIAHPDGRCVAQTRPLFNLAITGSGDVLCGILGGLIARNMDIFNAACAAISIHANAAEAAPLYAPAEELVKHVSLPQLRYDYCGGSHISKTSL